MKKGSKSYKIIVDTNIWISFLIGKNLKGLQNQIDSNFIKIITCNEQLQELSEVFKKPKIKKYFLKDEIDEFFELLEESSENFRISSSTTICRDPKDNYLISLAIDSEADFLITGDKDLLELIKVGETTIIKYTDFDKIE
ncbi:MAG: putative toxin-antitoxin system toxin component, PIN family [Bacteroidota bacterium]|nr:putative toxin-antitoxin system toxin component, PIN family [Bacteroidota bacterium]MDP3432040.1 putative toxin-antitoxin system toxin component, PIN family [Bacteroidota bacterium]